MEELFCYYNGQYIKESEARISLWDAGLMEGGVYDVGRTYNHVPFFWKEHGLSMPIRFCSVSAVLVIPVTGRRNCFRIGPNETDFMKPSVVRSNPPRNIG